MFPGKFWATLIVHLINTNYVPYHLNQWNKKKLYHNNGEAAITNWKARRIPTAPTARQQKFILHFHHAIHRSTGSKSKDIHIQDELNEIQGGLTPAHCHNNKWHGLRNHRGNSTIDQRRYSNLDVVPEHTPGIFGSITSCWRKKEKTRSRTHYRDQDFPGPSSRTIQPSTFGSPTARPAKRN